MPADPPLRVLHCLLDNLVFPLTRFDGADEILAARFPRKKKKKDCYQVLDCRKKRDVLVESNLLGEKCQTISIKELHFFNGIEELLKLIWRDNFSLKNWKIFRKFPISQ